MYSMYRYITLIISQYVIFSVLQAQTPTDTIVTKKEIPAYTIIGESEGLLNHLPGSVKFISQQEIQRLLPLNGNEVFRRIPGVHVTDEEGMGMRLNLGIRGLDPDRSRAVLVMEDGIPVSINPYGENELYYTPVIDRMEGVEVLKGSGQILYGPQTIGGIVNYITAEPSLKPSLRFRFMGGQGLLMNGFLNFSTTYKHVGMSISYLRKQAEAVGPTWFRINDVTTKFVFKLSEKSKLTTKLAYYDEYSNSTYVGLTQTMYDAGGQDFVQLAPDDRLYVQRILGSLQHEYTFSKNYKLTTTAFGYTTTRNWQRQDFSLSKPSGAYDQVWGDTTITNGALYMLNTNAHRDRRFLVTGIENRFSMNHTISKNMSNKLEAGIRMIFEKADEELLRGTKPDALSGNMQNDEVRRGYGLAIYAQDKFYINANFHITAGVRGEFYWFERHIIRWNYTDTSLFNNSFVAQIIPGIGLNYTLKNVVNIFGGIHRGFAPPRIKDAISNSGVVYNLEAEQSWNYEVGTRISVNKFLHAELTGFYMDFTNQVIPVSQSSGGAGSGFVNGGATRHLGFEAGFTLNMAPLVRWDKYTLMVDAAVTYLDARFNSDRYMTGNGDTTNVRGNILPYAPPITLTSALTFEAPFGLGLRLTGTYIGKQYTDPLNTVTPTADGRIGELPGYFLLDGSLYWKVPKIFTTFRLSVKNITNERYIASRRPQDIRVGLPMFITGGFEFAF